MKLKELISKIKHREEIGKAENASKCQSNFYFAYWCGVCNAVRHPAESEVKYLGTVGDYYVTMVKCPVCRTRRKIKEKTVMAYIREQMGVRQD